MLILTTEEIKALTGRSRYAAQIKVLRSYGLEVKVRPDGMPIVSRTNFEKVMGGLPAREKTAEVKLNLDAA